MNSLKSFLQRDSLLRTMLIFGSIFLTVFVLTIVVLSAFGFVPTEFEQTTSTDSIGAKLESGSLSSIGIQDNSPSSTPLAPDSGIPLRIVVPSIKLDTSVVAPSSVDYLALDNALAQGPVYYPGSGLLGKGNMFIFGHSTSFKTVVNHAYQVFNNIKNLKVGDDIQVYGENQVYIYKVTKVKLVNADENLVTFNTNENMLTISTCNSFGKKSDRYVAEAVYVSTQGL